jgi:glutamyl-tRNA reductase
VTVAELPAIDSLRLRAEDIVERLLLENEPHWLSLSDTDRRTVEEMTRTIAARLLDPPAERLAADDDSARDAHLSALCRLFALDGYATRRSAGLVPRSD